MCFTYPDSTGLTVTIESDMTVDEDGVGTVELCVNLDDIPAGGMEISVEVFLTVMGSSAGRRVSLSYCHAIIAWTTNKELKLASQND